MGMKYQLKVSVKSIKKNFNDISLWIRSEL